MQAHRGGGRWRQIIARLVIVLPGYANKQTSVIYKWTSGPAARIKWPDRIRAIYFLQLEDAISSEQCGGHIEWERRQVTEPAPLLVSSTAPPRIITIVCAPVIECWPHDSYLSHRSQPSLWSSHLQLPLIGPRRELSLSAGIRHSALIELSSCPCRQWPCGRALVRLEPTSTAATPATKSVLSVQSKCKSTWPTTIICSQTE